MKDKDEIYRSLKSKMIALFESELEGLDSSDKSSISADLLTSFLCAIGIACEVKTKDFVEKMKEDYEYYKELAQKIDKEKGFK